MFRIRRDCYVGGALALTLHVSRVFGMAPLRMARERGKWRVSYSTAVCFYSYILILGLHSSILTGMAIDLWLNARRCEHVTADCVTWYTTVILNISITTIGLVGAPARMKEMIEYLNIIEKVYIKPNDGSLNEPSERKRYIATFVYLLVVFLLEIVQWGASLNFHFQKGENVTVASIYIACCVEFFIIVILEMQFVLISMHVYSALKFVNDTLNDLIYILDMQSTTKRAQEKVRCLILSFGAICDVIRQVNKCYEKLLIALLGAFLINFIIKLYYFTSYPLSTAGDLSNTGLQIFQFIMITSYLLMVVEPGHRTEQELERTSVIVSQLLRRVSSSDYGLAQELDLFIKQITLNKLSYTPLGFCTLARPLIAAICGGVTSYFVIALQFQAIDRSKTVE